MKHSSTYLLWTCGKLPDVTSQRKGGVVKQDCWRRGFLEQWSVSLTSDLLTISSVLVAEMGTQSMRMIIPIESKTTKENKTVDIPVLLDTGSGGNFMNKNYAKWNNIILYPLDKPILPRNVDGSLNQEGKITHYTWVWVKLNGRPSLVWLLVTNLGTQDIIFGLPWFKEHNPQIEWSTGNIKLPRMATANYLTYQWIDTRKSKTRHQLQFNSWQHARPRKRNKNQRHHDEATHWIGGRDWIPQKDNQQKEQKHDPMMNRLK